MRYFCFCFSFGLLSTWFICALGRTTDSDSLACYVITFSGIVQQAELCGISWMYGTGQAGSPAGGGTYRARISIFCVILPQALFVEKSLGM
jgi:hypothetical protein